MDHKRSFQARCGYHRWNVVAAQSHPFHQVPPNLEACSITNRSNDCRWSLRAGATQLRYTLADIALAKDGVDLLVEVSDKIRTRLRQHYPLQQRLGDKWHLDEAIMTINGDRHFQWRAFNQDGFVLEVLVQKRLNTKAAKRFIQKLLSGKGAVPPCHDHK